LPDESIDLILCFEMVEHVADNTLLINMFKDRNRLLKRDGYMFIKTPNCSRQLKVAVSLVGASRFYKGANHPNPFDERDLRALVETYLLIEQVMYSLLGVLPTKFPKLGKQTSLVAKFKIAPSLVAVSRKQFAEAS
jgi:2-polyprenyl-3-methyl-5-hydroxy-6-metoxy-1,4-benzoquinol methylase